MQLGSPPPGVHGCTNPACTAPHSKPGVTFVCHVDPAACADPTTPTTTGPKEAPQDPTLLHPGSPSASSLKDSPGGGGLHAFSSVSGGDVGWEDDDGAASMSGYSAHSGKVAMDLEGHHSSYYIRLVRFYQKYNAEKIPRAEEFLAAYRGEEEQLFSILVSKYGPEPPAGGNAELGDSRSDNGSFFMAPAPILDGASGPAEKRFLVPTIVSPQRGNTDCVTPYWPGNKLIMDTDLLSLLSALKTGNEELRKCFLGVLAHHPTDAFNGMCYITRSALPQDASTRFLGHVWSGSLANNKLLVFDGQNFQRCVLHCTSACQAQAQKECQPDDHNQLTSHDGSKGGDAADGHHERWRLTIFRSESSSLVLFRTMWDPVIEFGREVRRNSFTSSNTRQKPVAGAATSQPQVPLQGPPTATTVPASAAESPVVEKVSSSVFSFFSSKKEPASSNASASSQVSSGRGYGQPVQPPVAKEGHTSVEREDQSTDVSVIIQRGLFAMEAKIMARLDEFERRLAKVELEVASSGKPSTRAM